MDYLAAAKEQLQKFEARCETEGSYPSRETMELLNLARTMAFIVIAEELRLIRAELVKKNRGGR
jgi:hypothetical protein